MRYHLAPCIVSTYVYRQRALRRVRRRRDLKTVADPQNVNPRGAVRGTPRRRPVRPAVPEGIVGVPVRRTRPHYREVADLLGHPALWLKLPAVVSPQCAQSTVPRLVRFCVPEGVANEPLSDPVVPPDVTVSVTHV